MSLSFDKIVSLHGQDYDPYEENPGSAPFSEPEAQIMRKLTSLFNPHIWVSVHSGMEVPLVFRFILLFITYFNFFFLCFASVCHFTGSIQYIITKLTITCITEGLVSKKVGLVFS